MVFLTDRKSHTGFPLVLKSVTLNDLDRRNGRYFALSFHSIQSFILQNAAASMATYVKLVVGPTP